MLVMITLAIAACPTDPGGGGGSGSGVGSGGDDFPLPDAGHCGNHVCDSGETAASCPQDCNTCGNHVCDANETAASCPLDCVTCGNNICDASETPASCPQDCHVCGNNVCEPSETAASCPSDCTATLITQNTSSYTIDFLYVYGCGATSEGSDQLGAYVIPSGSRFTLSNIPPGCYLFHAQTLSGVSWRTTTGANLIGAQTYTWTLTN